MHIIGIKHVIKNKFTTSKYTVKLHELVPIIWTKRSVSDSDLEQDPEIKRLLQAKTFPIRPDPDPQDWHLFS